MEAKEGAERLPFPRGRSSGRCVTEQQGQLREQGNHRQHRGEPSPLP